MHGSQLPQHFWAEAVNIAYYVMNKMLLRPLINKTSYKFHKSKKPNVLHFHIFECPCYIQKHEKDIDGNVDTKADKGIFLDYSTLSKVYRVYNYKTLRVKESINIKLNEISKFFDEEYEFDFDTAKEDHQNEGIEFGENSREVLSSTNVSPRQTKKMKYRELDKIQVQIKSTIGVDSWECW